MVGKIAVGGMTRTDELVLVSILRAPNQRGLASQALSALGNKGINLTCVTGFVDGDSLDNLSFAIACSDLDQTLGILQSLQDEIKAENIEYQRGCSALSIYGPHFSERPAIAGRVFEVMAAADVEILLISTSFSTVSFVTNQDQAETAVTRLQEHFLVP